MGSSKEETSDTIHEHESILNYSPTRTRVARATDYQVRPLASGPPTKWPGPAVYRPVHSLLAGASSEWPG